MVPYPGGGEGANSLFVSESLTQRRTDNRLQYMVYILMYTDGRGYTPLRFRISQSLVPVFFPDLLTV